MNDELEEQSALYVFGLLDREGTAAFERHLESDPELRALVDQLDETAAQLALRAPSTSLPPELRARVLAQVGRGKVVAFPRHLQWIPWAAAACLALSCAYLIAERSQLRHRITRLEERDVLARVQIISLNSKSQGAPNANAVVVWDERKQRGILKAAQLPRNTEDRDYQIWLIDPRYENPVNGGVFHVANEGGFSLPFQPAQPVRDAAGFAISLERKGGVPKAQGPIVLLGK